MCALRLAAAMLRPWPSGPDRGRWTVHITVSEQSATARRLSRDDARDAIDAGIVPMATEDPDVVAYAMARRDLDVRPLPWDRTYLSLSPSGDPLGAERASDAVRIDARPAEPLLCDTATGRVTSREGASSQQVLFEIGDPTARDLAERIVALAGGSTVATGLDPRELDDALRAGDAFAYIVWMPRSLDDGCAALSALMRRAPWLTRESITPLVDTRAHAVLAGAPEP